MNFEAAPLGFFTSLGVALGVTAESVECVKPEQQRHHEYSRGRDTWLQHNSRSPDFLFGSCRSSNSGTVTLSFAFNDPIQAWGLYITGLGTANGNLYVVYNDGTAQSHSVAGDFTGGSLFFGFTDAGKSISAVVIELEERYRRHARYVFGLDDMRYVADTTPPVIQSIFASRNTLWPPNHKMVEVTLTAVCTDDTDPNPICEIVGIDEEATNLRTVWVMQTWGLTGGRSPGNP